jgi:hypothetical protein
MSGTLFGENLISEDQITFVYSGEAFENGIPINSLINQLSTLEKLTRLSISEYATRGLIDSDVPNYQIFIQIESGSVKETLKVIFTTPWTYAILSIVVSPLLVATYDKALDVLIPDKEESESISDVIKSNAQLRAYCSELLSPITKLGGELTIKSGDEEVTYNQQEAGVIQNYLAHYDDSDDDGEPMKEGEFIESKVGVIRKANLDDKNLNYFGFNIDDGQKGIPMAIEGEFNFNDYRDLIDKPVVVTGMYRYKEDRITHIKLQKYEVLETITQLSIEASKSQED